MLVHLVLFKYRADVDIATRAQHRERLAALKQLDGVIELKVGEDVVRSPRSYDTALVITFPDRAALDAYQKDQQHVPIAQFGASLADHIVAVDFEI
jgi:rhamnose utilization protein RhaD (predicted bifunctional aldolase and dehydrogenase)